MPLTITGGGVSATFVYGPEHQRIRQTRGDGSAVVYAGAQEVEKNTSGTTVKTYWPGGIGVEIDRPGATVSELYWHHLDRLGSVIGLTDQQGVLKEKLGYDAWGKRRTLDGASTPDNLDGQVDNRGFTGHEMLDQLDLVHMNGRVYDPLVARFVSGDPLIQDPVDGQNYNRYSYVLNNPTNNTDPTGFECETMTGSRVCGADTGAKCSGNCDSGVAGNAGQKEEKKSGTKDGGKVDPKMGGHSGASANTAKEPAGCVQGSSADSCASKVRVGGGSEGPIVVVSPIRPNENHRKASPAEREFGTMIDIASIGIPLGNGYRFLRAWRAARISERSHSAGGQSGSGGLFGICFVAGTLIQTPFGSKNIEDIKNGDVVLAVQLENHTLTNRSVVSVFHNRDQAIIRVAIIDGAGRTEMFGVTPEHPFWVSGKDWIPAQELKSGDVLYSLEDGSWKVLGVFDKGERADTYNFEVDQLHNYFIGSHGILVHNQSKRGGENNDTQRGREAHKNYENALGKDSVEFNKALPSGRRPDAIDWESSTVRELKPDNARAIRRGVKQLEAYAKELEEMTGEVWNKALDLYRK